MPTSDPSKNFVLARETEHFRNSIVVPLTESHRHLQYLGENYLKNANSVIAFARMLDASAGDTKITDYISAHSKLSHSDREYKNLSRIFPYGAHDMSEIEVVFYDVIEAVETLLAALTNLFSKGNDQLRKVIIVLNDFINKLKKTINDTALKAYMHTKIEMIVKTQQMNLRAA